MITLGRHFAWGSLLCIVLLVIGVATLSFGGKKSPVVRGISPARVADYVHSIIEADRTVYTTHVVNRMQEHGIVLATEHWEQGKTLPLPAQFLQLAGQLVAQKGKGIRYRLISLWPIYRKNGPATEFERKGLKAVLANPDHPYTGIVTSGKKQYFQAIYSDRAVAQACVSCHNAHPLSPKRDFKLNDSLGGIVITIPLDEET